MTLISKTDPKGIDKIINDIQLLLFNNVTWADYESYHRAYKNERAEDQMYEVFTSGNEYKEVLIDDTFDATSFFIVSDTATFDERWNTTVSVIFQLNLKKLYPLIAHRADEEAHNEVSVIIEGTPGFTMSGLTKGIRGVYSDIGYGANIFEDMQPLHVFKLDINVNYDQDCCNDCV